MKAVLSILSEHLESSKINIRVCFWKMLYWSRFKRKNTAFQNMSSVITEHCVILNQDFEFCLKTGT